MIGSVCTASAGVCSCYWLIHCFPQGCERISSSAPSTFKSHKEKRSSDFVKTSLWQIQCNLSEIYISKKQLPSKKNAGTRSCLQLRWENGQDAPWLHSDKNQKWAPKLWFQTGLRVCCHQSRQLKPLITFHSHSFWLVGWPLPASQTSHSPAKNQSFMLHWCFSLAFLKINHTFHTQ